MKKYFSVLVICVLFVVTSVVMASGNWAVKRVANQSFQMDTSGSTTFTTSFMPFKFPTDTVWLFVETLDSVKVELSYNALDIAGNRGDSVAVLTKNAGAKSEIGGLAMEDLPIEAFQVRFKFHIENDYSEATRGTVRLWYIYRETK